MKQEVTYTPELLHFLNDDNSVLEITDQKKVWALIKQNYIVCDAELSLIKNFADIVKNLPPSVFKQEIQNFIAGLIDNKCNIIKPVTLINSSDDLLTRTCLSSKDKIYFSPTLDQKSINKKLREFNSIEFHSTSSFIYPEPHHRLKHLPTTINLIDGYYYDLWMILCPFLRSAKHIKIVDQYLPNEKARATLWHLIKNLIDCKVYLVFLDQKKYVLTKEGKEDPCKSEDYKNFMQEIKNFDAEKVEIDMSKKFKDKSHKDRWIFTDDYQISIPGGFDFLSENGFYNAKEGDYRQITIEKRSFAIDFL